MWVKRFTILLLWVLAPLSSPNLHAAETSQPPKTVVRQIDHVILASTQAKELFSLTETFQLPVAWPMADYGNFASGGVALGNVNLEIVRAASTANVGKSAFTGLALEPESLRTSLPELKARRIPHGTPTPFRGRRTDGSIGTRWTTLALPEISSDSLEIFFCEYTHDIVADRQRLLAQLRARSGGPLSVHSVREIVCGATELKRQTERWQKFLHPLETPSDDAWRIGKGPALRVVQDDRDSIQKMIINVTSLEQARNFLKQNRLLGTESPNGLKLAGPLFQGIDFTLVASPSGD